MPSTIEAVRAEALFVSDLQSSESPAAEQVRGAVAVTLRRLGIRGCAAAVAGEFGDHPDCAVTRMAWALATIRATYPPRRSTSRVPAARSVGTVREEGTARPDSTMRAEGAVRLAG